MKKQSRGALGRRVVRLSYYVFRKRLSDGKRQRVSHVDVSGNNVPGRGARSGKNQSETVSGVLRASGQARAAGSDGAAQAVPGSTAGGERSGENGIVYLI